MTNNSKKSSGSTNGLENRKIKLQNTLPRPSTAFHEYFAKQYQWLYSCIDESKRSSRTIESNRIASGGEATVFHLADPIRKEDSSIHMCVRIVDPWLNAQHSRLKGFIDNETPCMGELVDKSDESAARAYPGWDFSEYVGISKYGERPIREEQYKRFLSVRKGEKILHDIQERIIRRNFPHTAKPTQDELTELERKSHILFIRHTNVVSEYANRTVFSNGDGVRISTITRPVFFQELRFMPRSFTLLLNSGKSVPEAVDFGLQMAEALVSAQDSNFETGWKVHRDIKPNNIFYEEIDGRKIYLLSDFGFARDSDSNSDCAQTKSITFKNNEYSPPERLEDPGNQDITSDIYSICKCMYSLLVSKDDWEVWTANSDSLSPNTGCEELDKIIAATTVEKKTRRMYQDPKDFLDALSNLQENILPRYNGAFPRRPASSVKKVHVDSFGLFNHDSLKIEEQTLMSSLAGVIGEPEESLGDKIVFRAGGASSTEENHAHEFYERAAKKGSLTAAAKLGLCDINGIGTIVDREIGFTRIVKSARRGNNLARFWAGVCYYEGCGTEVDYKTALDYFKDAPLRQSEGNIIMCKGMLESEVYKKG